MRPLESMMHLLNEEIGMEVGTMLREFISSEEHQIAETPHMRGSLFDPAPCKP
jgi:hypothetical protein